jgi:hypothetical protein
LISYPIGYQKRISLLSRAYPISKGISKRISNQISL